MNTYTVEFFATCPSNSVRIKYTLCIKAINSTIPVEAIISQVQSIERGYHEDIADRLIDAFGCLQTITADHHGVSITTHRSGPAREFRMIGGPAR